MKRGNLALTGAYDESQLQVGTIRLEAERVLNIRLEGDVVMAKVSQNFTMFAGETKNLIVTVTEEGKGLNLTGSSIRWSLRKSPFDSTEILIKEIPLDIELVDGGEPNDFMIQLEPEDTMDLNGNYYHESTMIDSSGNKSVLLTGRATFK
ncbi:hypothetical protein [Paenibacillus sp. L3-i20]|uniref:hypothetical protein n=1 Tax=Paenibacillus sp. L3-i20 TaxID=2905833 RepID=UPI001EDE91EC|nr:hypothetical protein [Paenibacillus sp. L3-i20]GKU79876.1 hypothetical protein L3i20_v242730 [Paenibacillus sp. L3-i20]